MRRAQTIANQRAGWKSKNRAKGHLPLDKWYAKHSMEYDEQGIVFDRLASMVADIKSRNQCRYVIRTFMRDFSMSRTKARQLVFWFAHYGRCV